MMDILFLRRILVTIFLTVVMMLGIYTGSNAMPLNVFNDWTEFTNSNGGAYGDDGVYWYMGSYQKVGPGYGGQKFDAEHLFYKLQGNILSIGLQTGFNLTTGALSNGGISYYAGDLALSFDGNSSNYEYASDFGLYTRDYVNGELVGGNKSPGIDTAGIYKVNNPNTTGWNNDVYGPFGASKPFAMQSGQLLAAFDCSTNLTGSADSGSNTVHHDVQYGGYSYYRIVSFPVSLITDISGNTVNLAAHWTMSCGNDAINGSAVIQRPVVPEPSTMFLLGSLATGLFGFAGLRKRFTK